ncbi:MAG: DUF4091 domain-containing protein, partial [Armatimonadetes bacterium]|nr:DUF4091 domain-containing protein [Armatimonadota bacterium]
ALVGWVASCTGASVADRDPERGFTGRASGHIRKVKDGTSHVAALVFPRVDVTPGGTYTLSGWGRGHVPAGQAMLFLYQYDAAGQYLGHGLYCHVPKETDVWVPLHKTEQLRDDCAFVQVRFEIYGLESEGEAWVDDVYFGPDTQGPGPVRGLKAEVQGGRVRLSWQAPEGDAVAYFVYRSPYPRFEPGQANFVGLVRDAQCEVEITPRPSYFGVVAVDAALNPSELAFLGPAAGKGVPGEPAVVVWTDGPGHRWDEALPEKLPKGPMALQFEAARGEYENAQVFVGATQRLLRAAEVRAGALKGPKGATGVPSLRLFVQEYVNLPGWGRRIADPLVPPRAVDIEAGLLRGWGVQVYVPRECAPGDYKGQLEVLLGGRRYAQVPVSVRVWPFAVPEENHYSGAWGIWTGQIAEQEGIGPGQPGWDELVRRYREFFLEHRMIPRETPPLGSEEGMKWVRDPRLTDFVLPWPFARLPGEEEVVQLTRLFDRLRAAGVLQKGYVYIYDEPEEAHYDIVASLCKRLREAAPDVRILLTEEPVEPLYGLVDIWCPITPNFAAHLERCRQRQALGEEVWWYVCCGPLPPWPNYLLTNDLIDGRVLSWQQVKYNVDGELYWAVTCFPGNVWDSALGIQPGDGYLCYPGRPRGLQGPVTCTRAEIIRDAKEDIELIWLLRHQAAAKGQKEPAEQVVARAIGLVTTDFLKYTKDDRDIQAARRLIAQELVALGAR